MFFPNIWTGSLGHYKQPFNYRGKIIYVDNNLFIWNNLHLWLTAVVMVSIAVVKHHDKKTTWAGRVYLTSMSLVTVHWAMSRQEPGSKNRGREECLLLDCTTWLSQPAFLGMIPPSGYSHTNHQSRKCPTDWYRPILWRHFLN